MNALSYSVRISCVLKYFGQLCLPLAALLIVPLGGALVLGDGASAGRYAVVAGAVGLLGWGLSRIRCTATIQTNEAMAITALIFLFGTLVLVWPVMSAGLTFPDAWFETISGLTTTGLSTAGPSSLLPRAHRFARAWMQWVGGLGMVVLSLAVMIRPGATARRMGDMEDYEENLIGGTRANARRVLVVYASITTGVIALLWLLETGLFNAVTYGLASVSTGGFSPLTGSLAAMNHPRGPAVVIAAAMTGAVPLLLYYRIYRDGAGPLLRDLQVRGLIALGCLWSFLLALTLFSQGFAWYRALGHGLINALSAQSTAGFSSLDMTTITPAAKLILIFAMVIGGGIGSTAGGIKILRLLILFRLLGLVVQKTSMPGQAVLDFRLGEDRLEREEIMGTVVLVLVFVVCISLSWLLFLLFGHAPLDSLFEVVSALGTVGLSTGITDPHLHPLLKGVLGADMLLGRLEIVAWLIFLYPRTWIGRRMEA